MEGDTYYEVGSRIVLPSLRVNIQFSCFTIRNPTEALNSVAGIELKQMKNNGLMELYTRLDNHTPGVVFDWIEQEWKLNGRI